MATETPNFKLYKTDRADFVNIKEQLSDNMDIIDTEIKKAQDKADKAFQSASNGKTSIKNAITGVDPTVTIPNDATFQQLADAIGQIETGVNTDDATATAEKILEGMTAYVKGVKVTGTMTRRTGGEHAGYERATSAYSYPGRVHLYMPKGAYIDDRADSETGTKGNPGVFFDEPNLVSDNIARDKSILGIQGNTNVVNTSDGTIDAGKVLTGYGGYSKGVKVNGNMPNNGAVSHSLPINGSYTIPAGYHNGSGKVNQSVTTKWEQTYTPGTWDQSISAGQYLGGTQTIKGDSNLIPANILSGTSIFGVAGSVIAGKRYATGTTQVSTANKSFNRESGSQISYPYLTVSNLNLGFTPRIMVYHLSSNRYYTYLYFREGFRKYNYPVLEILGDSRIDTYSAPSGPHEYLFTYIAGDFTWYAWE